MLYAKINVKSNHFLFLTSLESPLNKGGSEGVWKYRWLLYKDIEVEVHYVLEVFLNIRKNRRLQKWFANHQKWIFSSTGDVNSIGKLITPSLEFNVFYILLHIYRHFLYEGIGLRQLMDYYFVLK